MPQMLLAGDRNVIINGAPVSSRIIALTTNSIIGWSPLLHRGVGNVALSDGSVQGMTGASLSAISRMGGAVTNRLAIP